MSKAALLLSVRPRYVEQILAGTKTAELRRVRPAVDAGARVLLYASSPTMALLGSAIVQSVDVATVGAMWPRVRLSAGVSRAEYAEYFDGATSAIAIWLEDIRAFAQPITLAELRRRWPWLRPPQSFRFVDAAMDGDGRHVLRLAPTDAAPSRRRRVA